MAEKFPLSWPAAYPRTKFRSRARFKVKSFINSVEQLYRELRSMGASSVVVSTNIPIRNDGMPYSNPPRLTDPGVAIYFQLEGRPMSMACDKWDYVEHNMHALELTIEAMRGLDRWGASDMLNRVFQGFTALPAPTPVEPWWKVLHCPREWSPANIEAQFKRMIKTCHPDVGGSHEAMTALNRAIAEARAEKGA